MPLDNTPPLLIPAGSLDATLAGDGTQSIQIGISNAGAEAIAIQADGKYVVAGWSVFANDQFTLLRLNSDGSVDTSFSGDGFQFSGLQGRAYDVVIQPDGEIVAVGSTGVGSATDFLVTRFDANGQPDTTFSDDGIQTTSLSASADIARAVAIQTDDKIVVAGGSGFNYAITRYDIDGALDPSFDGDGKLTGSFGNNTSSANAMVLQEDGKIIVAGYGWNGTGWDLGVARLTGTGALDATFSGDGKALISVNDTAAQEAVNAIAVQTDGKILLAGNTINSDGVTQDAVLIRLNANGTLDTSFGGGDGIVTLNISPTDNFNSVQIQADGKILAAGSDTNGFGHALIARFNADGTLDTTFSDDGVFTLLYGNGTSTVTDLVFAANGQAVAVGNSYTGSYDFGILRLAGGVTQQTIIAGNALRYVVPEGTFYDADGDSLTFSASLADGSPLPDWLSFDTASSTFSGTPAEADFGTLELAVHASDGTASVAATFQLEVSTDFIEALRIPDHSRWNESVANGSPGTVLTFSFMTAAPSYALESETSTFAPMNEAQKAAVRDVLRQYHDIAGISFTEVADAGDGGQLRFGTNLDVNSGHSGYAYYPSSNPAGGDVWINRASADYAQPNAGNAAYWILLHETGHALGFKHPGAYDNDVGPFLAASVDTNQYTVMSYNNHGEGASTGYHASSPMLYDVAAIQFLYGSNTSTRSGDDTYTFNPAELSIETLWDGGGTDTLDISNFNQDCVIDLRAGAFSSLRVLLPAYEWVGPLGTDNVAIAYGCVIENAIGGSGNDTLIGNSADNTLSGGLGNDTYVVDTRGDRIIETSSLASEIDSVQAMLSWTLGANLENLSLLDTHAYSASGNHQNNTLSGNDAGNILNGGSGADTLIGGVGNDTYVVDNANDLIQEAGSDINDSVRSWVDWTLGDNLENLTLLGSKDLAGTGNSLDNTLTGNGSNNTLNGGGGNDFLDGASGNDTLTGGAGSDTFAFTTPLNTLRNVDTITDFISGSDKVALSSAIFHDLDFSAGPSSDSFFFAGSAAHDLDDRILYDQTSGSLSYDADGTGALAAIQFALLSGVPQIHYTDFVGV